MKIRPIKRPRKRKGRGILILSRRTLTFWRLSERHRMVTYSASEEMHYVISTRYIAAKYFKGAVKARLLDQVEDDVERYPLGWEGHEPERWIEISRHKQYQLTAFGLRLVRERFLHREPKPWQEWLKKMEGK